MSQILPLIVGVTGHRCLCEGDLIALRDKVREIFVALHAKYPHTPFILLSRRTNRLLDLSRSPFGSHARRLADLIEQSLVGVL